MLVDLDLIESWPEEITRLLNSRLTELSDEYVRLKEWEIAGEKLPLHERGPRGDCPSSTVTDQVLAGIANEIEKHTLRVFHATRLVVAGRGDVLKNGLKKLSIEERKDALLTVSQEGALASHHEAIKKFLQEIDPYQCQADNKVDLLCFNILRRHLFDGGCDSFFDYWGGELVGYWIRSCEETLYEKLNTYGLPYVVIAKVPINLCKSCTASRLAETMKQIYMEKKTNSPIRVDGFSLHYPHPVPSEDIEGVILRDEFKAQYPAVLA